MLKMNTGEYIYGNTYCHSIGHHRTVGTEMVLHGGNHSELVWLTLVVYLYISPNNRSDISLFLYPGDTRGKIMCNILAKEPFQ